MGMFDYVIVPKMIDFGPDIPPILPSTYQTKNTDCYMEQYFIEDGFLFFRSRGSEDKKRFTFKRKTEIRFYNHIGYNGGLLSDILSDKENLFFSKEECDKVLFWPHLFSGSWIEYTVLFSAKGELKRLLEVSEDQRSISATWKAKEKPARKSNET